VTTGTPGPASMPSSVDRATAITEDLIDRGAPWSSRTSWRIVLVEGVVGAVVGLLMLFKPFGGSSTTLQIVGLILLGAALINAFELWRNKIRPDRVVLAAFRSGSGVTVGLLVIVATFLTNVTDTATASLAAAVGVGFVVFGIAGVAMSFVSRTRDETLPLAGLIANAVILLAGAVLTLSGAMGAGTVDQVFSILGIALMITGLGLCGYAYLLYQQEATGVRA